MFNNSCLLKNSIYKMDEIKKDNNFLIINNSPNKTNFTENSARDGL